MVRGAVARGMTRPTFRQLMPAVELDLEDSNGEQGNADLRPFLAWQYDLGVEYYFGENDESAITFAVFAKDVQEFIFTREFSDANGDPASTRTGIVDGVAYTVDNFELTINI